jgi:hypothetical protein
VVEHETGLPSDPLVRTSFKAIADWVSNYRRVIGLTKEFDMCRPDEVMRMAKEIGMTPSQLHKLSKGQANADLLTRILVALHVDPKVLADMDPLIVRELKWLCSTCSSKNDAHMSLPREQLPRISKSFAPMPCRSMSYSIRKVNCHRSNDTRRMCAVQPRMSAMGQKRTLQYSLEFLNMFVEPLD